MARSLSGRRVGLSAGRASRGDRKVKEVQRPGMRNDVRASYQIISQMLTNVIILLHGTSFECASRTLRQVQGERSNGTGVIAMAMRRTRLASGGTTNQQIRTLAAARMWYRNLIKLKRLGAAGNGGPPSRLARIRVAEKPGAGLQLGHETRHISHRCRRRLGWLLRFLPGASRLLQPGRHVRRGRGKY